MENEKLTMFDENIYPIAWRFNADDCFLSTEDKRKIIFIIKEESQRLWDSLFYFKKLMDIDNGFFNLLEKKELDFDNEDTSRSFFNKHLESTSLLVFFWGRSNCAIIPSEILIKSWTDFFYPSDDNCIIYIANKKKIIFSYEETFFYGDLL